MEIGEIREYNGQKHICIRKDFDCTGCSYRWKTQEECDEVNKHLGHCSGNYRKDGENVVFVILAD